MRHISRREFGAMVAAGVVTGRFATASALGQSPGASLTARDVVERIQRNIGVAWKAGTVDTVKAGDPATVVTGVVTTALATLDVLRQAVEAGANLVVTCEPAFYGRSDARTPPAGRAPAGGPAAPAGEGAPSPRPDPVYAARNRFIDSHGLVVFRLSEHWRLRTPDPFVQGLADALGWSGYRVAGDLPRYDIPAVALDAFASDVKRSLGARGGIRVVGDPRARVRRVALLPGSTPIAASLQALPAADAVVAGEVREWESVEYARDVAASGQAKGLVLTGRIVSEDPGMAVCASWLGTLVPEVPVRHIAAGDPYWRPLS